MSESTTTKTIITIDTQEVGSVVNESFKIRQQCGEAMQKIIRRQIYLVLLVATAIASPICSATSPPIVLQVDQIIKSKMSSAQEQQIEKAQKKVVDARTSGDTKSVEVAESNLAKKVESIDLTRKIIIIGRMQVTGRAQPGGVGPVLEWQGQQPCALLVGKSNKKIELLQADDFIQITKIVAGKGDQPGRGPRNELQELVSETILDAFTNAFVVSGWKKTTKPSNWPQACCETPWMMPSKELTKRASLVVRLDEQRWEYKYLDQVRFMLHIKNDGTETISSANICFVFLNSENKPIYTQNYYTNSAGDCFAVPRIENLKPGDSQVIETFATKSISAQMSTISVAVMRIDFETPDPNNVSPVNRN